jgi:hypothetical protein
MSDSETTGNSSLHTFLLLQSLMRGIGPTDTNRNVVGYSYKRLKWSCDSKSDRSVFAVSLLGLLVNQDQTSLRCRFSTIDKIVLIHCVFHSIYYPYYTSLLLIYLRSLLDVSSYTAIVNVTWTHSYYAPSTLSVICLFSTSFADVQIKFTRSIYANYCSADSPDYHNFWNAFLSLVTFST